MNTANKKYKHIFFDLDRTLWDFDTNAHDTICEIFYAYGLDKKIDNFEAWLHCYKTHNKQLWDDYGAGKITKKTLWNTRFYVALKDFGIDDKELGIDFSEKFAQQSPNKVTLFPNAIEVLQYLSDKYNLHIVTNGFSEIQYKKIENTGIGKYFKNVFTSEKIGYNKPHAKFFSYAVTAINARKSDIILVGDDFIGDIIGAKNYGIDQVYFNPQHQPTPEYKPTFTIDKLIELKDIL